MLNLDSCRALALRNNKQMGVAKVKQDVAANLRKSARTKYLPRVSAMGGYMFSSKEVSLLSDEQKTALGSIGTSATTALGNSLGSIAPSLTPEQMAAVGNVLGSTATSLNAGGQQLVSALRTDTRNMFAGAVMVTQPVFMGGSIVAMNKIADINEQMAANSMEARRQSTIYSTDMAYWTVVSLKHKKKLAESYLNLVETLSSDVSKMISEGVATRADGLNVEVKVNEAEMTLTQVEDGLTLAKMHLCQMCGLPLDEELTLADEDSDELSTAGLAPEADVNMAFDNRPELKMLQNSVDVAKQTTNILKAGNLPQVLMMGGYSFSNPSVYNGFRKKLDGVWNIGVMVRIPIWNWRDVTYKVRASKGAATIAQLEMEEARELVELQVSQSSFKMNEAYKKLAMAQTSTKRAEENLRCANIGFKEGVMQSTTVMEAQTAWLQAQSQKIDAEIDVKQSRVNLQKALGTLQER